VAVSGVVQDPSTYSVSGTTLTFSGAPPSGSSNISVRFLGIPASNIATTAYRTVTEFTATAGQTTFSVPSYTAGYIDVYRNGVMLGSADYTATNGTTVVLASGATAGDLVEVISFYVSSVLNAIPAVANAVTTSYINDGAVTKAKMAASGAWAPAGTVLQVVQGTTSTPVTISSTTYTDTGLTASITPTSATSKILVLVSQQVYIYATAADNVSAGTQLLRNSTTILAPFADGTGPFEPYLELIGTSQIYFSSRTCLNYLDSPATTSSVTYKTQGRIRQSTSGRFVSYQSSGGANNGTATIILMEIAA
jgi:hypothetical protein